MTIAVDFDGTLFTENNFPNVGLPIFKTINKIKQLKKAGHTIILWTCRVGKNLKKAINACKEVGLEFDYYNENDTVRIEQFQNDPRKIGADVYIDDRSIRPDEINILLEKQEKIWN